MSTTTNNKNVDTMIFTIINFMNTFLSQIETKNNKIKTKNLLSAFEEQTSALRTLISTNMPRPEHKLKDPDAPKRPCSAYIYFTMDKREVIKAKHKDATAKVVLQLLGSAWQELSEKDREPYKRNQEKATKKYKKEMEKYTRPSDAELAVLPLNNKRKRNTSGTKIKRDPELPKRVRTAYMYFSEDMRTKVTEKLSKKSQNVSNKDVMVALGDRWKKTDVADRAFWVEKNVADKKRFEEEMKKYMIKHPNYVVPKRTRKGSKDETKKDAVDEPESDEEHEPEPDEEHEPEPEPESDEEHESDEEPEPEPKSKKSKKSVPEPEFDEPKSKKSKKSVQDDESDDESVVDEPKSRSRPSSSESKNRRQVPDSDSDDEPRKVSSSKSASIGGKRVSRASY